MVSDRFHRHFDWKQMIKLKKSYKSISPVPVDSKFYGEFDSDNQDIDLYSKTISFDEKTMSKSGSMGPLCSPFKVVQ